MMIHVLYYITLSIAILSVFTIGHHKNKDGKLILNPIELIDLVREEQNRNKDLRGAVKQIGITTGANRLDVEDMDIDTTECEDAEALKNRKIWSRWGKWSACSVSCGNGVITRRRACVAGRCARGELEEQRRPCARAPCAAAPDCAADDSRDLD